MAKKKMISFDLETTERVTKEGKLRLREILDAVEKSGVLKDCYRVNHDKVDELFCQQVKNRK